MSAKNGAMEEKFATTTRFPACTILHLMRTGKSAGWDFTVDDPGTNPSWKGQSTREVENEIALYEEKEEGKMIDRNNSPKTGAGLMGKR